MQISGQQLFLDQNIEDPGELAEMIDTSKLHIISGIKRDDLAEAILEYRAFIRRNPTDKLAADLADVLVDIHEALHQQRAITRAIR